MLMSVTVLSPRLLSYPGSGTLGYGCMEMGGGSNACGDGGGWSAGLGSAQEARVQAVMPRAAAPLTK